MSFGGTTLHGSLSQPYVTLSDNVEIPKELIEYVEEISQYEHIPVMSRREAGIYRHESAECELMPSENGGKNPKPFHSLKVKGKKLDDVRNLIHMIKTGTIRPVESYEAPQGGKSRQQLMDELRESNELVDRTLSTVNTLSDKFARHTKLLSYIDELFGKGSTKFFRWPFIRKQTVARMIKDILEGETEKREQ